ncbi:MAG: hypothetical protein ABI461_21670 [Polyangiaceae bacterium]
MNRDDDEHRAPFVDPDRELIEAESSEERFDRVAFAMMALDRVPPRIPTIAVYESRAGRGVRVDEGRNWAVLSVPRSASKRAIIHAVAAIAKSPIPPFSLASLESLAFPYR